MPDQLEPLQPDLVGYAEKCDAAADKAGREITKTIRFPRPDGSTAILPLTRDHGLWLDFSIRKRLDQSNRSWVKKIEPLIDQLERLAERVN